MTQFDRCIYNIHSVNIYLAKCSFDIKMILSTSFSPKVTPEHPWEGLLQEPWKLQGYSAVMKSIVKRIVTKIKVLHPKFRRGRIGLVRGVWNLISNQASLV